ncbi:MAG TPA: peptide chain release factor 1 [Micropepsaceae bacterium]|nr:peptide chain release factor 1 [Micropepsaceae bacterium]
MIPEAKLERVLDRFHAIEAQLAAGHTSEFAKLSKEHAQLAPVVNAINAYKGARDAITQNRQLLDDPGLDTDLKTLASEELGDLNHRFPDLERDLRLLLLPKDSADNSSAIIEVRAGTGGDEASLFAGDLLKMYTRYAQLQGWKTELLSLSDSDLGGVKEAVLSVAGEGAYARLKFESGVHRVQRVPVTEASGRIHTSAATVAVLPEPEDVDVNVEEKDLRIDVYRASGAGGQHVNKTESAVRITHIPSGIVVAMQEEKSQHKNRAKAMKILKARLFEAERERTERARAAERKGLVGSGDRSERIRTYNFPQGRVSDHRINLTLYKLDRILAGDDLGEVVDALVTEDQANRLAAEADAA